MVSTVMNGQLNQLLAGVEEEAVHYQKSQDLQHIEILENHIKHFFEIDDICVWYYDKNEKKLQSLKSKKLVIPVEESLIQQSIQKKVIGIENYLRSHKYYRARIDNPYNKNIKSMLFYPILEEEEILGVVTFSISQYNQHTFETVDVAVLEKLRTTFVSILQDYTKHTSAQKKSKQEPSKVTTVSNNEVRLKDKNDVLETHIRRLEEKIARLQEAYNLQETKLKVLDEDKQMAQKHIIYLEKKVQDIEAEHESKVALKGSLLYDKENNNNLNLLLMKALPEMKNFKYIYMLYEFIFYESQGSSMRIKDIDVTVKKSKLLDTLLGSEEYNHPIPSHITMMPIQLWLQELELYQAQLEKKEITLEIEIAEDMPSALRCDGEKMLSVCFHLLNDILHFSDTLHSIKLEMAYHENKIFMDLRGEVFVKQGLFSTKKFTSIKNRLELAMAKKLIGSLSGHLKSYTLNNNHIHQLIVPVESN